MTNHCLTTEPFSRAGSFPTLALAALAAVCFSAPLSAQTGEDPITAGNLLASAPSPGSTTAAITFGAQINDGRTETRGYSLDGTWARMWESHTLLRFQATARWADFRPTPGADRIEVDDTRKAALSLVHPLTGALSLLGEASWERDEPVGLDHRVLAQAGLGLTVTRGESLQLTFGPTIGVGRQNNAATPEAEGIVIAGGVQTLAWRASTSFGLETNLHGYSNLDDSDDFLLDFSLGATSRVTSRLGMKVSYSWTRTGIHPPSVSDTQRRLEIGATLTLLGG